MFKRDWTTSSHFSNHSTLNSEHNWENLCIFQWRHTLLITITKLRDVQLSIQFLLMLIIDVLMQHKFHCVNQIGRSWRTWKTNWITPTDLNYGHASGKRCAANWSCKAPSLCFSAHPPDFAKNHLARPDNCGIRYSPCHLAAIALLYDRLLLGSGSTPGSLMLNITSHM